MGEIIAVLSQKGGVGKTTTVINLGASLALKGKSVLLVDFDPQRQILASFRISDYQLPFGVLDLLADEKGSKSAVILSTSLPDLNIATLVSAKFDEIKVSSFIKEKEERLKKWFKHIERKYDFVFLDCPSSLSAFSELALKVANSVIVPVQCEFYALKSLTALLKYIKHVRMNYNPELFYRGFLITMVDLRSRLARLVWQRLRSTLSGTLFQTHIPRNIKLAEVPLYGRPVPLIDKKSKGAQHYDLLADEILHQSVTIESSLIKNNLKIANNF